MRYHDSCSVTLFDEYTGIGIELNGNETSEALLLNVVKGDKHQVEIWMPKRTLYKNTDDEYVAVYNWAEDLLMENIEKAYNSFN